MGPETSRYRLQPHAHLNHPKSAAIIVYWDNECAHCVVFMKEIWPRLSRACIVKGIKLEQYEPHNDGIDAMKGVISYPTINVIKDGKRYTYTGVKTLESLLEFTLR